MIGWLSAIVPVAAVLMAVVPWSQWRFITVPPPVQTECQPPVIIYAFLATIVFYNVGWWVGWYETVVSDEDETRDKKAPVFTGKHFLGDPGEKIEMVLVARRDLNMSTGMLATQSCHAGVALYKKLRVKNAGLIRAWESDNQCKSLLYIKDEHALSRAQAALKSDGLPTVFIRDKKEVLTEKGELIMGNRSMLATMGPPSRLRPILGDCDVVE